MTPKTIPILRNNILVTVPVEAVKELDAIAANYAAVPRGRLTEAERKVAERLMREQGKAACDEYVKGILTERNGLPRSRSAVALHMLLYGLECWRQEHNKKANR